MKTVRPLVPTSSLPSGETVRSGRRSDDASIRFLIALARALHRYGTAADRLEETLAICAGRLGIRCRQRVTQAFRASVRVSANECDVAHVLCSPCIV